MAKVLNAALAVLVIAAPAMTDETALAHGRGGGHFAGPGRHGPGFRYGFRGYGRGLRGGYWGGYYGPWYWGGVPFPPYYYYDGPYGPPPVYYSPPPPPPSTPPPPAPPVERPAPPPPPPVAAPERFEVYFPFDQAVITPSARQVIGAAAAYRRRGGSGAVIIVGHTDTSGSEGYNQALSERRARAVRDTLIAAGVEAGAVETDWKGKHDLEVETPDGTKEPRNRRVTILVERSR
jgi:outer membrane protein OmpA-like peptidoglycan-associated protein